MACGLTEAVKLTPKIYLLDLHSFGGAAYRHSVSPRTTFRHFESPASFEHLVWIWSPARLDCQRPVRLGTSLPTGEVRVSGEATSARWLVSAGKSRGSNLQRSPRLIRCESAARFAWLPWRAARNVFVHLWPGLVLARGLTGRVKLTGCS